MGTFFLKECQNKKLPNITLISNISILIDIILKRRFLLKLDMSENQGITQHKIEALDNLTQDKLLYEQKKLD